MHMYKLGQPTP